MVFPLRPILLTKHIYKEIVVLLWGLSVMIIIQKHLLNKKHIVITVYLLQVLTYLIPIKEGMRSLFHIPCLYY